MRPFLIEGAQTLSADAEALLARINAGVETWNLDYPVTPRSGSPVEMPALTLSGRLDYDYLSAPVDEDINVEHPYIGILLGAVMRCDLGSLGVFPLLVSNVQLGAGGAFTLQGLLTQKKIVPKAGASLLLDNPPQDVFREVTGVTPFWGIYNLPSYNSFTLYPEGSNSWQMLQSALAQYGLEYVWSDEGAQLRRVGSVHLRAGDLRTGWSASIQEAEPVAKVSLYVYEMVARSPQRVKLYPYAVQEEAEKMHTDNRVISVGAGESLRVELPLNGVAREVETQLQPYNGSIPGNVSGYMVVGKDNRPVMAQQWLDFGGRVTAEVSEDGRNIVLTVVGASLPHLAPFRLAESDGSKDYPALQIYGNGMLWEVKHLEIATGAEGSESRDIVLTGCREEPGLVSPYTGEVLAARLAELASAKETLSVTVPGVFSSLAELPGARLNLLDRWWRTDRITWGPDTTTITARPDPLLSDIEPRPLRSYNTGSILREIGIVGIENNSMDYGE